MPKIYLETKINAPQKLVFDLARSVDLHLLTSSDTNERVIKGKSKGLLDLNDQITWRAKHLGVNQNLTVEITAFESPHRFTDTMIKGAFKSMVHHHNFYVDGAGTLMIDQFHFEAPFGILGKMVNAIFLKKYMTRFLKERNVGIKMIAENGEWKKILKSSYE